MNLICPRASATFLLSMAAGLLLATSAVADDPFSSSPLGVQHVLVIPVEFPTTNPCPNPSTTCPVDPKWFASAVGPPRHTPAQWENLLNSVATGYWHNTTYNQTDFQFTVLSNPNSDDGWWPAPHSLQDYFRNCDSKGNNCTQWYPQVPANNPPSYPFVPDVTASVVQSICSNPILVLAGVCNDLKTFNRLLVIPNFHSFGAQSLGNDYAFGIATGTSLGTLTMSATAANEGGSDADIAAMLHELGHQMGELSHYGDCSHYAAFTSFNPILPAGPIECLDIGWDLMGLSDSFVQLSGYSMVSRGWIDPGTTLSYDLIAGGPFSQNVTLYPLETSTTPNVIRLSLGDLSWPEFLGYYVECRERIGEDVPNPFPSIGVDTLKDVGVLITNVHEFSVNDKIFGAPAHHIERPLLPSDKIGTATLKPGDTFSDPTLGLSVRFNGYLGGAIGTVGACSVSIANLESLPPPPLRRIRFAGSAVLNPGLGQLKESTSIPLDVGLNHTPVNVPLDPATAGVPLPVPVEPPWVGHDNPVLVRVNNQSPGPVENVQVGVSVSQPAMITDTCGSGPPPPTLGTAAISSIPPASSMLSSLDWTPDKPGSVSIDVTATGPGNQINTSSRFAFQFHHLNTLSRGISTRLNLALASNCSVPESLFIASATSVPGWQILVSPPSVSLNPGQHNMVNIQVIPPPSAEVGDHAEIPILVRKFEAMLPGPDPNLIVPGVHFNALGALTILARVTGGPGSITLNVPGTSLVNSLVLISGAMSPGISNSPISIEYRSPSGHTMTHIVQANGTGGYSDSITPGELGHWTVQSRWPGDNAHDPVESAPRKFIVYATSKEKCKGKHMNKDKDECKSKDKNKDKD
jgi:hypothetical protein